MNIWWIIINVLTHRNIDRTRIRNKDHGQDVLSLQKPYYFIMIMRKPQQIWAMSVLVKTNCNSSCESSHFKEPPIAQPFHVFYTDLRRITIVFELHLKQNNFLIISRNTRVRSDQCQIYNHCYSREVIQLFRQVGRFINKNIL